MSNEVLIALISSISGAITGSLITVFSDIIIKHFRNKSELRASQYKFLLDWWKSFRKSLFNFDLSWSVWIKNDHANFNEPKPWISVLSNELMNLRTSLGPCLVRTKIDQCLKEFSRVLQLEMEYLGQAKEAFEDFNKTTSSCFEILKSLEFDKAEHIQAG